MMVNNENPLWLSFAGVTGEEIMILGTQITAVLRLPDCFSRLYLSDNGSSFVVRGDPQEIIRMIDATVVAEEVAEVRRQRERMATGDADDSRVDFAELTFSELVVTKAIMAHLMGGEPRDWAGWGAATNVVSQARVTLDALTREGIIVESTHGTH